MAALTLIEFNRGKRCAYCLRTIPWQRFRYGGNPKFCADSCRYAFHGVLNRPHRIHQPHKTAILRGAANECRVAADLFDRGYCVFWGKANFRQGDLVAVKDGKCLLIEVKTGFRRETGTIWPKKKAGYDVLAVVLQDGQIVYDPELPPADEASQAVKLVKGCECTDDQGMA